MDIKNKIDNTEYEKYSKAVVKLLSEGLKEGEYFIFSKSGEYGMILSEERLSGLNLSHETKMEKIFKALTEEEDNNGWFTGKADNYKLGTK